MTTSPGSICLTRFKWRPPAKSVVSQTRTISKAIFMQIGGKNSIRLNKVGFVFRHEMDYAGRDFLTNLAHFDEQQENSRSRGRQTLGGRPDSQVERQRLHCR